MKKDSANQNSLICMKTTDIKLYTCEIRFYDVIDRTIHTFTL